MRIWGVHKKYKSLSWWENFMSGHLSVGPVTVFGANAMNWAVNIKTQKWGYICFTLPAFARRRTNRFGQIYYDWYFYLSPNGTPWAATYYVGFDKNEHIRAKIRKLNFGHGFDTSAKEEELRELNNKFGSFSIL